MLEGITDSVISQQWHVIRTIQKSERLAVQELVSNGFDSFCPRIKVKNRDKAIQAPIFPGYVFARRNLSSTNVHPVFMLPHVRGWVTFGGYTPTVPDDVINELSKKIDEINANGGLRHRYEVGDLVRVTLCNVESIGKVVGTHRNPDKPIEILLDFMGRDVPTQISVDKLQPFQFNPKSKESIPRRSRGKGRLTRQYKNQLTANTKVTG